MYVNTYLQTQVLEATSIKKGGMKVTMLDYYFYSVLLVNAYIYVFDLYQITSYSSYETGVFPRVQIQS